MNAVATIPAAVVFEPTILTSTIPARVEALSPATAQDVNNKVAVLRHIRILDAVSLAAADDAYNAVRKLRALVEDQRVKTKAPVLEIASAIDNVARPILQLLDKEIAIAKGKIDLWNAEQQRKYEAEKQRLALEAQRIAREEDEKRRVEAKRLADEQAAAAAKATAEAEQINDLFGTDEPVVVAPLPVAPTPAPLPRTIAKAPLPPPPMVSKSVGSSTRWQVEIFDARLVPYEVDGVVLCDHRMTAIDDLLKQGVAVPGARRIQVTTPVSR